MNNTPCDYHHGGGGLLVVVDQSETSKRAVTCLCKMLCKSSILRVVLAHMLPPFPPELIDIPDPQQQKKWLSSAKNKVKPALDHAAEAIQAAGLPETSIEIAFFTAESNGYGAADMILELAREHKCAAIMLGREQHPWYYKLMAHDIAHELRQRAKGFALLLPECAQLCQRAARSAAVDPPSRWRPSRWRPSRLRPSMQFRKRLEAGECAVVSKSW